MIKDKKNRLILYLIIFIPIFISGCSTGNFKKGMDAYKNNNYALAISEWKSSANHGDSRSQLHLGIIYDRGEGVKQNYQEAAKWYRLAASNGNPDAQFNLGWLYSHGKGVTKDVTRAVHYYRLAAIQGLPIAQQYLGSMYRFGTGLSQNNIYAYMWLKTAADNGEFSAKRNLNQMEKVMSVGELEKAKSLVQSCKQKDYKGC